MKNYRSNNGLSRLLILFAIYQLAIFPTYSQVRERFVTHSVQALAEVPVQFGVSYNVQLGRRISAGLQTGFLSAPNSSLILYTLEQLGTERSIILMIEDAFHSGFVLEGGINYHFGKNYGGVFIQNIDLEGKNTPRGLIESAMGVEIPENPRFPGRDRLLTLESRLLQAGLLFGRRVPIKNSRSEFRFELAASMNVDSRSSISSPNRDFAILNERVNSYLSEIYRDYAIIPSLSIIYTVRLGNLARPTE